VETVLLVIEGITGPSSAKSGSPAGVAPLHDAFQSVPEHHGAILVGVLSPFNAWVAAQGAEVVAAASRRPRLSDANRICSIRGVAS
jgi:hypothetical protein